MFHQSSINEGCDNEKRGAMIHVASAAAITDATSEDAEAANRKVGCPIATRVTVVFDDGGTSSCERIRHSIVEPRGGPSILAYSDGVRTTCNSCGTEMVVQEARAYAKDGFEIVRCPLCDLVFRAQMPTPEELGAIYNDAYFASSPNDQKVGGTGYLDYVADEELHRINARKRLGRLSTHAFPGRLLDVGCAAGFFLDEARHAGWEPCGIELAPNMAAWARERLGLAVERVPFAAAELEPHGYDAITMWDYIEHSIDPSADLHRSYQLLKPGGILALSTGDIGSFAARLSGSRWHLLTPRHHNFFFQPHTLRRMLEQAQFSVLSLAHGASWYSVEYLVHKLRTMIDRPAVTTITDRLQGGRLGRIRVPVNLWDIMTVVARAR